MLEIISLGLFSTEHDFRIANFALAATLFHIFKGDFFMVGSLCVGEDSVRWKVIFVVVRKAGLAAWAEL